MRVAEGRGEKVREGEDVCEGEARALAVKLLEPEPEREAFSREKRAEADTVPRMTCAVGKGAQEPSTLAAEGVAAFPEGDGLGERDADAATVSVRVAEGEREPPTGLSVGKGAREPSRLRGERVAAPVVEGALDCEGEPEGERDTRPDGVPVPRTSCPAVGKGCHEPSKLAGVAVGALGVGEKGALRLTSGLLPDGDALRVPPSGLSVGKGAREPARFAGEREPPSLAEGDEESETDGRVEREPEVDDVEEREGAGEVEPLAQRVSVPVGSGERETAVVTESVGFAGAVPAGEREGGEEGEGGPLVGDALPDREPPSGLSVGKGAREPIKLAGEPVAPADPLGAPLGDGGEEGVGAREGEAAVE